MADLPIACQIATIEAAGAVVIFDHTVYRPTAIKKAAYKFGDRCHVHLDPIGQNQTKVILRGKQRLENVEHLAGEFCNEVLDQELREVVAQETDAIRNLLLAQAFSKTSLIQPEFETADFHADPSGIKASDNPSHTPH